MATMRKLVGLALASVKPGYLVLAALGVLVIILVTVVAWTAIYASDPERRTAAQEVLRTLFGRDRSNAPPQELSMGKKMR